MVFIAGVIGMGAVVSKSGHGDLIGRVLFSTAHLAPENDAANFAALNAIGMAIGMVTTIPGQPAIMTTLAANISAATRWPLVTALMAQDTSWLLVLFPYELPPLVMAAHLGGVRVG